MTGTIDFTTMMKFDEKKIEPETLIFTEKVREWCKIPYPGANHKYGCPNDCPARKIPASVFEKDVKENYDTFFLIWSELDFTRYKELRAVEHNDWSPAQVKSVYYWQNSVKSILSKHIAKTHPDCDSCSSCLGAGSGFGESPSMEAAGIFVFATLVKNHIPFEKKPVTKILTVALAMEQTRSSSGRMTLDSFIGGKKI